MDKWGPYGFPTGTEAIFSLGINEGLTWVSPGGLKGP